MKPLLAKIWQFMSFPKKFQLAIMRLTQDEFLVGVTGVILNQDNEILVCNHSYRDGKYWSLPGGYIKGKEHPREAIAREIEEETGFIVRINDEIRIKTDREAARLDISLVGSYVGGTFKPSSEVLQAGFFGFDNLPLLSQNHLMLIKEVLRSKTKDTSNKHTSTNIVKASFWNKIQNLWTNKSSTPV
jgi:8-oxo-dGTP diphosphatase